MTTDPVLFTVLVPLYRTRPDHFRAMVDSVLGQTETHWQLVLVDDGSADPVLSRALTELRDRDERITVVECSENRGIVSASAAGLEMAVGKFVALVDHDDLLDLRALAVVREAVEAHPTADVLYTDEDQLHDDGEFRATFRKPAFSPERLRGQNYLGHLTVYRRSLLEEVGGFRAGFDGSQDYDLVLRATERARTVVHIPEVVYHWRIHAASVSHRSDNAPVFDAARRALAEHLRRVGIPGTVEQVHDVGVYRIRRELVRTPRVTIVIPTRGSRSVVGGRERVLVVEAVRSLLKETNYPDYDVIIVADRSTPAPVLEELRAMDVERVRVVDFPYPFNYSEKINAGAARASGELLLLLNDDTEVMEGSWLTTMVSLLTPDVGMVGACLLYEDGSIQHLGLHVGAGHVKHVAEGGSFDDPGPFADHLVTRETSGVTGACALVSRAVFDQVGGLSMSMPVNFNDVDFGFKILDAGYRILLARDAVLHHFESRSRKRGVTETEVLALRRRWSHRLESDDFWRHEVPAPRRVAVHGESRGPAEAGAS